MNHRLPWFITFYINNYCTAILSILYHNIRLTKTIFVIGPHFIIFLGEQPCKECMIEALLVVVIVDRIKQCIADKILQFFCIAISKESKEGSLASVFVRNYSLTLFWNSFRISLFGIVNAKFSAAMLSFIFSGGILVKYPVKYNKVHIFNCPWVRTLFCEQYLTMNLCHPQVKMKIKFRHWLPKKNQV